MDILKIIILFAVLALIGFFLKRSGTAYGTIFSIFASTAALSMIVIKSVPMVNEISMLAENAGVGTEYITVMIKALGVSYITDFAVDTCKEAGETSLASKASLCGKLAMTGLAIPLIKDMLQISIGILER